MKKLVVLLAVLCFLAMAVNAMAQKQLKERVVLSKVDANKDGKVTFDEVKALYPDYTEELHQLNDVNKDGVLQSWEWYRANLWPEALAEIERKREAAAERVRQTAGFLKTDSGTATNATGAPAPTTAATPGAPADNAQSAPNADASDEANATE